MKSLKSRVKKCLVIGAIALSAGVGVSLAVTTPASAFSTIEMHQACRLKNYGHNAGGYGWTAQLTYPNQGVYGWRCFYYENQNSPATATKYSMEVQLLCNNIYGGNAKFTKQSDAYSWYCG